MKTSSLIPALALAWLLVGCGPKEPAAPAAGSADTSAKPAAATPAATPAPAGAVAENTVGKSVYGKVCVLCHAGGVGGAPKPGDKGDWGPRIAQGNDVLYKHALEGFTGTKGAMPPRGGNAALSDDDVKAAVNYMADQAR